MKLTTARKIKMREDLIVCGELWKKGKEYDAEQNEYKILVEELKVAKPVTA